MVPVTEEEIRHVVRSAVAPHPLPVGNLFVEEFVVSERGRIDLALIGDRLSGFELKSDLDTLHRLPRQMATYGEVFDFCTLVVTQRHLPKARELLLPGWGLAVVKYGTEGLSYRQLRRPRPMKTVRKQALAQLLWRDEALHALDALDAAAGVRSKPRDVLWQRLCDVTELDQLRAIVTNALTARQGWRDVQAPHARVERSQPAGGSSRFLARRLR
ncbi:sce7726 family protein [Humibacter ginsenosidimutans]|uniref:Sce7726 family protein n=1 Tax=Humibacter ginsenosidimutans TaxID=2599293 RepID=A0A5B8M353_9MICO|nr:sce7726 family protein [Humibacter ginsenosidimutans]